MFKKLSWKPDLPDQRDYLFSTFVQTENISSEILPENISLRKWCSEIEDQRTLGSCVANAIVGIYEYNRIKNGMGGKNFIHFSRLFNYYNSRVLSENVEEDSGTYIRDGIKTAKLNGICPANDWPYRLDYFKIPPPINCYQSALNYRVSKYYRINTLQEMKQSLFLGHPFVFGIAVYPSFLSEFTTSTGIVNLPTMNERLLGGHAMLAIGYNDLTQRFLIRNSWGKSWGLKDDNLQGYCTIPYTYLENRSLSDDFWVAF